MSTVIAAAGGVAVVVAAVASVFANPDWWTLVFYIQSSGANEVHVPLGYWLVVSFWMWLGSRTLRQPLRSIAPRCVVVAFVAHVLVLLAALAPMLADPGAFTTSAYHLYTRTACAVALSAAIAWSAWQFQQGPTAASLMAIPIPLTAAVLAFRLFQFDPPAAAAGLVAGMAVWHARDRVGQALPRLLTVFADDRVFAIVIFAAAVAMRLFYLQRVMSNPGYLETGADGPVYDELAWSIAQGKGIRASFTERFPLLLLGYVWFVSAIYRVAGHSYFAVGAVQAVIGGAVCVLFYGIARELCGRTVARTAAVFSVISFPLLFAAAAIGHQAVDVFLTMVIVWVLVKAQPAHWAWWRWGMLGALFGLAIAIRETVTFFLAFVLLWIPFLFTPRLSKRGFGAAAMVMIGAFVTIAPLIAPKVATETERAKLRHHFDILYRGEADPVRMRDEIVPPLSNPDAALEQLRQSPGLVLGTLARAWASNFAVQFFAQPYGGFDLVFLRKGTAYYYALWFYAYALALAGAVVLIRRLRIDPHAAGIILILGLIASRTLPHLILESNYRHRVPIEPFLILLAAVGVVRVVAAARRPEAVTP